MVLGTQTRDSDDTDKLVQRTCPHMSQLSSRCKLDLTISGWVLMVSWYPILDTPNESHRPSWALCYVWSLPWFAEFCTAKHELTMMPLVVWHSAISI